MSVLALKLNLDTALGPLTSTRKTELLGIGHQRENLESGTCTAAMNNNNNNNNN